MIYNELEKHFKKFKPEKNFNIFYNIIGIIGIITSSILLFFLDIFIS